MQKGFGVNEIKKNVLYRGGGSTLNLCVQIVYRHPLLIFS